MIQGGMYHLQHDGHMGNLNSKIDTIIPCKECYTTIPN